MPKSSDLIQKFQKDFGLTVDFMEVFTRQKRFNRTASMFLGSKEKKIGRVSHYKNVFSKLLDNYIENYVRPHTTYDQNFSAHYLKNIDVMGLAERYEEIMQAMHEEATVLPRQPYEASLTDITKMAIERLREFSQKTVIQDWGERVKNGKLDLGDMRDLFKKEDMAIENKILMYHTMKDVIDNRSVAWYFNPLNWRDWHHQRYFMTELAEVVEPLIHEDTGERIDGEWELNFESDDEERNFMDTVHGDVMYSNSRPMLSEEYATSLEAEQKQMEKKSDAAQALYDEYIDFARTEASELKDINTQWTEYLEKKALRLKEQEKKEEDEQVQEEQEDKERITDIDLNEADSKDTSDFIPDTNDQPAKIYENNR